MEKLNRVYVSPDGMVLATAQVKPMFQSGIRRYPLEKGKWYKLSKKEDIQPGPNGPNLNHEFIHIVQYEDDELFKNIPHKLENFLTIEEWRDNQLEKLL
jgi:hypothetical protein